MSQPLSYIPDVVESHLDEIAFLYEQYLAEIESAESDPDYLRQLARRLRANINGVLLVSDVAWGEVESGLGEHEGAAFFTAGVIAFGVGHVQRIKQTIDLATEEVSLASVAFALAWLPWDKVSPWAEKFLQSKRAELIYLGLYAYLWHRKKNVADVQGDYERIFSGEASEAVVKNTLKLIFTTHDMALVPVLRALSAEQAPLSEVHWQILETRLQLGDATAIDDLKVFMFEDNPYQEAVTELCFSRLDTATAKVWLRELQNQSDNERLLLIAIGALKEKALLPWVLNQMQDIKLARLAGKAVGQIVGVDIEAQGWVMDDERLDEQWLEMEGDETLPWPDKDKIQEALGRVNH